jgi:hypothetical protein
MKQISINQHGDFVGGCKQDNMSQPTYFLMAFVITFREILLEYS